MAQRGWMTRTELDSLRYWHARGLHDTEIAKKLGRTDSCISQHRRARGLRSNYTPEARSAAASERMRELRTNPEFERARVEALHHPEAVVRQIQAQRALAEEREDALSKIPADDPLLQALRHVHGSDGQARREREARA